MTDYAPLTLPDAPKLVENLTHFARALRKAGLPVGPGRVMVAIEAVQAAGFTSRIDFYWALHAVFVSRPEERGVFHQVFRLFWRDPRYMEHMMALQQARRPSRPFRRPKPDWRTPPNGRPCTM